MDLSLVIVSWNTREILKDCLRSVYEQTRDLSFEVIVVDNASDDGSPDMVAEEFPQAKLIRHPSNAGFAAANNIGLQHVSGRYVLLLNSDTVVLDGALQKTVMYADAHPEFGVVSCKVLNEDLTIQPNCSMFPSLLNSVFFVTGLYKLFPKSRLFGRQHMTWWDYSDEREVQVVKGCFMLARSEAIEEVGPMDEQFFMYSEEVDWCYRFHAAGWRIGFFPEASIVHLGGASAVKLGGDRALVKDRSTRRFLKKHWSPFSYYAELTLMFGFYCSRLPLAIIACCVTKGNNREKYEKIVSNHWTGLKGLFLQQNV